jgi:hypothetical protein
MGSQMSGYRGIKQFALDAAGSPCSKRPRERLKSRVVYE